MFELWLHPMLVLSPIALLFISVQFDPAGAWFRRENVRDSALWLLILGLLEGVAAAIAGAWGEEGAEKAGIRDSMIETHGMLAIVTLGMFGVLLLGRLVLQNQCTRKTMVSYFLIATFGLGTLSATGDYGRDLV